MKAQKGKKGATDEKGPHPYDFSLKRDTKLTKSDVRPLKATEMATGLVKKHGLEKAKLIVEPLTVTSFKDGNGNPVAPNESASYWTSVLQLLNKGTKNAVAS